MSGRLNASSFVQDVQALDWYHPACNRHIAESLLMQNGSDGSYLLRPSNTEPFVISIRCKDSVKHFPLTCDNGKIGFGLATFDSIDEFKAHFLKQPFIAGESGLITWLRRPYPREVSEPDVYDRVRIHAHLQDQGNNEGPQELSIASKEGYMTKLGGFVKNWKVRWFVLMRYELKYFKQQADTEPIRVLDLRECTECTIDTSHKDRQFCFQVMFPWRTFFFSCESGPERDEWVRVIQWKLKQMKKNTL